MTQVTRVAVSGLVVALLAAACGGGGGGDGVSTGGPSSDELPSGPLVAGNDVGWVVEELSIPESGVVEDPKPHRVYRVDRTGRTEALPALEPMGIFDTLGSGNRLVVGGARCADSTLQEHCAAVAEVAVLDPGATEWRRIEIAHSDNLNDLQFVIIDGDDERTRLLTDYDGAGRKDGRFHVAELDSAATRIERWGQAAPANAGGFCALDGVVYGATTSGGFLTPVQPGAQPDVFEPVPVSYQIYASDGGSWRPAPTGAWSGKRARGESMACTNAGFVARVADGATGFLRWTAAGGWDEQPAPAAADRTALSAVDGEMVGIRAGQIVLERTPGDLQPLAGVPVSQAQASGPVQLPPLAISRTSVVSCDPVVEGEPAGGMDVTGLRNCTVVDRP